MKNLSKLFRQSNVVGRSFHSTQVIRQISNSKLNDGFTHFGFQTVAESEKAKKVHEVFKNVAETYDKMNDFMSMGIHRIWKDIFIQNLGPTLGTKLLDVAGGTGDIAFRYVNYLLNTPGTTRQDVINSGSRVTIADINESMLKVGQERARDLNFPPEIVSFKVENAEELSFKDNEFSAYTISFGLRNVTHIDKALAEAYRVLKPGGRFMCLEFSQLNNNLAQWVYDQYSFKMIPVMGQLIAGNMEPYQYLVESIKKFPNQESFKKMIEEAGFRHVTYENYSMGIVAIHSGFKI